MHNESFKDDGTVIPDPVIIAYGKELAQQAAQRLAAQHAPRPQPWSPPEDPDKPRFPYLPGFSAEIHRHDVRAETEFPPVVKTAYLKTVTHSASVVLKPPADALEAKDLQTRFVAGKVVQLPQGKETFAKPTTATLRQPAETAQLVITASIAIGAARGAQVVACTITPGHVDGSLEPRKPAFQAAAKIFDPLYYDFKMKSIDSPHDCASDADQDYRTETAAYEHLTANDPEHKDSFAPKYYGSWTLPLPITINGQPYTRYVRLILIELLNGTNIQSMRVHNNPGGTDAFHYPEEYRLEVLARALEGYARQLRTGLNQNDFAGRNVMLVAASTDAEVVGGLPMPRVVLTDYNIAWITDPTSTSPPVNFNPFELGRDVDLWEQFGGWVPNEWAEWEERTAETGTNRLKMEWLSSRFSGPPVYPQPSCTFNGPLKEQEKLRNEWE